MTEISRQFLTPLLTGEQQGYGRGRWEDGKHYAENSLFPDLGVQHKQPHQMSPDEFAEHPYAVFHSSHRGPQSVQDLHDFGFTKHEYGSAFHFGSEQAAMDRSYATMENSRQGIHEDPPSPVHHHVFWYLPTGYEASAPTVSDEEANKPEYEHEDEHGDTEPINKDYSEYYTNAGEDFGSTSVAVRNEHRLRSHRDFVKQAIAQGKSHEIHPETMRQYQTGRLGILRSFTPDNIDEFADSQKLRRVEQPHLDLSEVTPLPQTALGRSNAFTRAPNIQKIRDRRKLDVQEGGGYLRSAGLKNY